MTESVIIIGKSFSFALCGTLPIGSYLTNVSFVKFKLNTFIKSQVKFYITYQVISKHFISTINRNNEEMEVDKSNKVCTNQSSCHYVLQNNLEITSNVISSLKINTQHVWIWHIKTLKYLILNMDSQTLGNSLLNSIYILHGFESSNIIQTIDEAIQNRMFSF